MRFSNALPLAQAGVNVRRARPRKVGELLGVKVATEGASVEVLLALGIPREWAARCEDAAHVGHDGTSNALASRLEWLRTNQFSNSWRRSRSLARLTAVIISGNARWSVCSTTTALVVPERSSVCVTVVWVPLPLRSRGFGPALASGQFRALQQKFSAWNIPLPGGDKELVYAPLSSPEANSYLDDLAFGANFATLNHLLINAPVLEAFQEVIPGVKGSLVYFISHNIARKELLPDGRGGFAGEGWVRRKGATLAFAAGHPSLKGTPFAETAHPILLPGNCCAGSLVMTADKGAEKSAYSVNHGAGGCMGRKAADGALDQKTVETSSLLTTSSPTAASIRRTKRLPHTRTLMRFLIQSKPAGFASEVARL